MIRNGIASVCIGLLVLCVTPSHAGSGDRPRVVASFSVLADLVREVAGEHARVRTLAPVGAEVHEYELRPSDFMDLEDAQVIFYNGLVLEQWMGQVRATVAGDAHLVGLAEQSDRDTLPIVTGDYSGSPDPHLWMDPRKAKQYVTTIADTLSKVAPQHEAAYHGNAEAFNARLDELHDYLGQTLSAIPDEGRTLITSEAAFLYFANAYDFEHDGIWGTNSETEGTSKQLMRIIDIIGQRQPRAIFWESTISDRYVQSVSGDTGIAVAGPLYVDSLGEPGSGAESYIGMMETNAQVLVEALADD